MTDKIKRGQEGEELAASFLEEKGYTILERNYRHRKSEIDLIVCKDRWLVFVEVKTRTSTAFGFPEEFVDYAKKRMIFQGALHYMTEKDWQGNVRYDIIAIHVDRGLPDIHHIEDAFY
ncbi:MAG TPA: YraN family protein [Cyclobacteriaceae bacterium]|jgi:putative endonuclease|nr:YraN family protein [Cyclobacteriaceae bacterium]